MVAIPITSEESKFLSDWKKKKAENDAKHKKASNSMASRCVFAIKKLVGK